MATLSLTRDNIIESALRKLGVIGQGDTAAAVDITDGAEALNVVLTEFEAMPWVKALIKSVPATLSTANGTASYNLDNNANWIESMTIETTAGYDEPLRLITAGEYAAITAKGRTGIPQVAFVSEDLNVPGASITPHKVYLWPVPNAIMTLEYYYRTKITQLTAAGSYFNLPPYMTRAIVWALAEDLAFEYGKSLEEVQVIARKAEKSLQTAMGIQGMQISGQKANEAGDLLNSVHSQTDMKRVEAP